MQYGRNDFLEPLDSRVLLSAVTRTFQDGLDGYVSTYDTYVSIDQPATSFGADAKVQVDGDSRGSIAGNQPAQGLIRFRDLFGAGGSQVPAGATITGASLTLVTGAATSDDSDSLMSLHRMLRDWTESSTWNSLDN